MVAGIGYLTPSFVSPDNLVGLFNDTSILIMVALGQMTVILTKCIDLSVGANIALTGVLVALINAAHPDVPVPLLMLLAAALGAGARRLQRRHGLARRHSADRRHARHAVDLSRPRLPRLRRHLDRRPPDEPGLHRHPAHRDPRPAGRCRGSRSSSSRSSSSACGGTRLGRTFFATGGNPVAAVYTGINVGRTQFIAFCISGTIAGFCGYLWASRYTIAYVDIAGGFELEVIAACVIGGMSIAGGIGTVAGAVLGALFLGVVKNALPVIHVSPFWQLAISGAAILGAVIINSGRERRHGRLILEAGSAA